MRIAEFEVRGLFGVFDHVVPMKLDRRVTIIHGPNGYGKTMMLDLLADLFQDRNGRLRGIPYDRLTVRFDDGSVLTVEKRGETQVLPGGPPPDLFFEYTSASGTRDHLVGGHSQRPVDFPLSAIEHTWPELERVGARLWSHAVNGELLTFEEVMDRYPVHFPGSPDVAASKGAWLKELRASIPIHVIKTQRLLVEPRTRPDRPQERRPGMQPAVTIYATELAATIQAKLGDYANLAQSLDRTFPIRVVKVAASDVPTPEALQASLDDLERTRRELREAGLLDIEHDVEFPFEEVVDDEKRGLLAVYVADSQKKFAVFKELAAKTELMRRVINSRFLYKQIEINREAGISAKTENGRDLPLTALSSGEQHELVLLYELLFKVDEGSLILLDEPELSLHVEWQSPFLDDLAEIADRRYLDVVVATHSPQLIGDRLDLTVELRGPGE